MGHFDAHRTDLADPVRSYNAAAHTDGLWLGDRAFPCATVRKLAGLGASSDLRGAGSDLVAAAETLYDLDGNRALALTGAEIEKLAQGGIIVSLAPARNNLCRHAVNFSSGF